MKIVWSPLAIERVSESAEYIAQDSPEAATKWVDNLFEKVKRLKTFHEVGGECQKLRGQIF
ncbi:MAG: type II toxin-antitoxin system RelE/ParE family toxin [Nitrospirota bacterium]